MDTARVIIIGSGPAGLTAAVYTARANLQPLVIEGIGAGGQLMLTTDVENYPGFPDGILGPELMAKFREQAERFGAEFVTADADRVDFSGAPFAGLGRRHRVPRPTSIIISTGATARMLGLPSEQRLLGHGVSTCATCDGFFFRGRRSRSSAAATPRSRRRCSSPSSPTRSRSCTGATSCAPRRSCRTARSPTRRSSSAGTAIVDDVHRRRPRRGRCGCATSRPATSPSLAVSGLFVAIGHDPNTKLFVGQLDLDENGYIVTDAGSTQTSVEGVFAAGDVQDHVYRQAITAAGTGCMAALEAER